MHMHKNDKEKRTESINKDAKHPELQEKLGMYNQHNLEKLTIVLLPGSSIAETDAYLPEDIVQPSLQQLNQRRNIKCYYISGCSLLVSWCPRLTYLAVRARVCIIGY